MPTPFPGMDPFIECQEWEDFHTRFMTLLSDMIGPAIQPDYFVRVERRLYVEFPTEDSASTRSGDVVIIARDSGLASGLQSAGTPSLDATECMLPMPEERREIYLVIRERQTMRVVTVIELLSPANKRSGGNGREEYLKKRMEVLSSDSYLVAIDLLRGGKELPVVGGLPPGDYHVCISRAYRRPTAEVYSWTLRQPLPTIPVPLKRGDADAMLSLQEAFSTVYQRARYDLSINYQTPLQPPPCENDGEWIKGLLLK